MARKAVTHASIQAKIKRWKTRLRRALNAIDKLEKQERALERRATLPVRRPDNVAPTAPTALVTTPHAQSVVTISTDDALVVEDTSALHIPAYLKRAGKIA